MYVELVGRVFIKSEELFDKIMDRYGSPHETPTVGSVLDLQDFLEEEELTDEDLKDLELNNIKHFFSDNSIYKNPNKSVEFHISE